MSPKRIKLNVVDDNKSFVNIAKVDFINILNSDSDTFFLLRKHCKRLIIKDDTDNEDHNHQQSELD